MKDNPGEQGRFAIFGRRVYNIEHTPAFAALYVSDTSKALRAARERALLHVKGPPCEDKRERLIRP
jgi:hypothetical protein